MRHSTLWVDRLVVGDSAEKSDVTGSMNSGVADYPLNASGVAENAVRIQIYQTFEKSLCATVRGHEEYAVPEMS